MTRGSDSARAAMVPRRYWQPVAIAILQVGRATAAAGGGAQAETLTEKSGGKDTFVEVVAAVPDVRGSFSCPATFNSTG